MNSAGLNLKANKKKVKREKKHPPPHTYLESSRGLPPKSLLIYRATFTSLPLRSARTLLSCSVSGLIRLTDFDLLKARSRLRDDFPRLLSLLSLDWQQSLGRETILMWRLASLIARPLIILSAAPLGLFCEMTQ